MRAPQPDTTYVFVFLGEFGYELLNWQGVVRRFRRELPPSSDIVVATRHGLEPFYECASAYIDLTRLDQYRNSVAASYFALPPGSTGRRYSADELDHDVSLRRAIETHVTQRLGRGARRLTFVFSSSVTTFPGCIFGADRRFQSYRWLPGKIYSSMRFLERNNDYSLPGVDLSVQPEIEKSLGLSLDSPFILIQLRSRRIGPQVGTGLDLRPLIEALAERMPVVALGFETGRLADSGSRPGTESAGCRIYSARSFREQGCLIALAHRCVFATEGDLGSHTYLPPLMGRDVYVVASAAVFAMRSAPVDTWNESIFRGRGRMIRILAERVAAPRDARAAADLILARSESD